MTRSMKKTFLKMAGPASGWLGLIAIAGWLATGCQTPNDHIDFTPVPGSEPPAGTNGVPVAPPIGATGSGGRFAVGDLVRVTFSGVTDPIAPHEERIKDDGTVTLPLILAIKAEGKTPGELQQIITKAYVPEYYKRLTVTVSSDRRVYYVGGQVRSPNRQEYLERTTVTKAIQSAGDFTDFADRKNVLLTRADGTTLTVNCIKAAKNPALDPPVYPGDKIEVKLRGIW